MGLKFMADLTSQRISEEKLLDNPVEGLISPVNWVKTDGIG
nr:hypothetical protein [Marinifilum sp. N1E240]